jgi:hypothetical protein
LGAKYTGSEAQGSSTKIQDVLAVVYSNPETKKSFLAWAPSVGLRVLVLKGDARVIHVAAEPSELLIEPLALIEGTVAQEEVKVEQKEEEEEEVEVEQEEEEAEVEVEQVEGVGARGGIRGVATVLLVSSKLDACTFLLPATVRVRHVVYFEPAKRAENSVTGFHFRHDSGYVCAWTTPDVPRSVLWSAADEHAARSMRVVRENVR